METGCFSSLRTSGDLLGRPLFEVEELPYPLESLLVVELSFAATGFSASGVSTLRYGRRIPLGENISFELSEDRRFMTSKTACDLGNPLSAVVKRHELFAFEWCKMSIRSGLIGLLVTWLLS